MPKPRPVSRRPLPKRRSGGAGGAKVVLAAKPPKAKARARALPSTSKKRPAAKVRLHQSGSLEVQQPPIRRIPWWVFPEHERSLAPSVPGDATGSVPGIAAISAPGGGAEQVPSAGPATIRISGGYAFPQVTRTTYVSTYPGMTIRQALAATGLVAFGPAGNVIAVSRVPVDGGRIAVRIQLGGRVVPETMLNYPIDPNSTILAELYTIGPI